MKVHIPTTLQSYTKGQSEVELSGKTVGELLDDLDRRYPGSRFRIVTEQETFREHVRIFVNNELTRDLARSLADGDEVHIISALSGG